MPRSLAIVFPAFDEERRLPALLEAVVVDANAAAAAAGLEVAEIVVVDDGSSDRTAELVRATRDVSLVSLATHRGKGAALARGVAETTADLVLISDVDLSTPLRELVPLAAATRDGAAIAIGSRAVDRSRVLVHQSWLREHLGRGFNVLVRRLTGLPFHDTQCGFKLFRGDVARTLFRDLRTPGFAYDVEILLMAARAGLRIDEIAVEWRNDRNTTVSLSRSVPSMLIDLVRLRARLARRPRSTSAHSLVEGAEASRHVGG